MTSCYVCGSTELARDADPHSPTCEACKPALRHIISMNGPDGDGSMRADCRCGWASAVCYADRDRQELAVYEHWRGVIRAAGKVPA